MPTLPARAQRLKSTILTYPVKKMVYDIITIGSATIDIFLKSNSKDINIEKHESHDDICMPIGTKILIKELTTTTGGGGTNTACSFKRMGFKTGWIGKIGNDLNSKTIEQQIKEEKIDLLGCTGEGSAGLSIILTGFKHNRTILAYKGINDKLSCDEIKKAKTKWYYLASMMGESWKTATDIAKQARKKDIPLAFNPSTYLAKKGMSKLKPVLDATRILILNKEEALALSGKKTVKNALATLQAQIPLVVITDGPRGAIAYNGINKYTLRVPKKSITEATGAGDAFASTFVASIIKKQDIPSAMQYAYCQAANVLSAIGAKNNLAPWKKLTKKGKVTTSHL